MFNYSKTGSVQFPIMAKILLFCVIMHKCIYYEHCFIHVFLQLIFVYLQVYLVYLVF